MNDDSMNPYSPPTSEVYKTEKPSLRLICSLGFMFIGLLPIICLLPISFKETVYTTLSIKRLSYSILPTALFGCFCGCAITSNLRHRKYLRTLKIQVVSGSIWAAASLSWWVILIYISEKGSPFGLVEAIKGLLTLAVFAEGLFLTETVVASFISRVALRNMGLLFAEHNQAPEAPNPSFKSDPTGTGSSNVSCS